MVAEVNALGAAPAMSPVPAARAATSREATPLPPAVSRATVRPAGGSTLSIDPALGITVLRFFSAAGDLTQSFPSQRQLQSYQIYGFERSAEDAADSQDV